MLVNQISLGNYRNYRELKMDFHPNLNILLGGNAQGKTNVLEAIFYAATGKSHRTNHDYELVLWGEKFFRIVLSCRRNIGSVKIEIAARVDGKKILKVNNQPQKRLSDLIGTINVVLFSPEDMLLVKGSPSVRRRFLDIEISQISNVYCHHLVNYNKVVSQRNNLLKAIREQRESAEMLDIWDMQLVEYGSFLIKKRSDVLEKINPMAKAIHSRITEGKEELFLSYLPSVEIPKKDSEISLEEYYLKRLKENRYGEIARGTSLLGPHRDDIEITVGNTSIRSFGSQGQQRTCALSMKLAEIEFMKSETGEYPVLLLDDVMSELDAGRRKFLFEVMDGKVQTFVTSTGVEDFFLPIGNKSRIFEVKDGKIFVIQEG